MVALSHNNTFPFFKTIQVGVQCAIDPEAGASALEDKVNSVLPLANKEGELENN
jgi:hypothetical protein